MKSNAKASVPYRGYLIDELRADHKFAVEYLKAAMESLDVPSERAGGLFLHLVC